MHSRMNFTLMFTGLTMPDRWVNFSDELAHDNKRLDWGPWALIRCGRRVWRGGVEGGCGIQGPE